MGSAGTVPKLTCDEVLVVAVSGITVRRGEHFGINLHSRNLLRRMTTPTTFFAAPHPGQYRGGRFRRVPPRLAGLLFPAVSVLRFCQTLSFAYDSPRMLKFMATAVVSGEVKNQVIRSGEAKADWGLELGFFFMLDESANARSAVRVIERDQSRGPSSFS